MNKKSVFFIVFLLLFCANFVLAAEEETRRVLEIKYPTIPRAPTIEYVDVGLPKYVEYVFRFSIVVFGLLVLGVLIYNGVNYLLSLGNPTKLSDARQGITAGFLGGLILFASYIIFNTINPKLVTLELPPATIVKAVVVPGVYICNYRVSNPDIGDILTRYQSADRDVRNQAAKDLRNAMGSPENPKKVCFLVNYSGLLSNFTLKSSSLHTIFIVPEEKFVSVEESKWEYTYAIVLHETDRYTGFCRLLPKPKDSFIYRQIDNYAIGGSDFTAKAVTVIKKPFQEPVAEAAGVTLYEGLGFNGIGWEGGCTPGKTEDTGSCKKNEDCKSCYCEPFDPKKPEEGGMCTPLKGVFLPSLFSVLAAEKSAEYLERSFPPVKPLTTDVYIVTEEMLKEKFTINKRETSLYRNTRSIRIEPKNGYIAILYGDADDETKEEANERCEVRKTDDANLMDDTIGRCGACGFIGWLTNWLTLKGCFPCLESMIVVKGQVL